MYTIHVWERRENKGNGYVIQVQRKHLALEMK